MRSAFRITEEVSAPQAGEPSAESVQCAEQGSLQPDWDSWQEEFGLVRFRGRHTQRVAAAFGVHVAGPVQGEAAFDEFVGCPLPINRAGGVRATYLSARRRSRICVMPSQTRKATTGTK